MSTTKPFYETALVERTLGLPTKAEELDLFSNYDTIGVFDRYLPLVDYLLDEYACPNDETRMIVEETVYTAHLMAIAKFRRMGKQEQLQTFSFFLAQILVEFLEDFAKEGKVYKISTLQVVSK